MLTGLRNRMYELAIKDGVRQCAVSCGKSRAAGGPVGTEVWRNMEFPLGSAHPEMAIF